MECLLHHTYYFERFFDFRVSLIFRHANAKLAPEHWTIIVIENIANSCFRSSTVKSCGCLLSRLVPVLNDTHRLAWIIFQLPHVSLFVCDEKSEEKEWCLYKWFHNTGFNPAVSETLLTYPSSRQKNFPSRIGHIYWLLHFADVKYRQETVATRVPLRRFRRFLRKRWLAVAQANWKTNRGKSRGIPGRDFRCRWLSPCLRNRWVVPLFYLFQNDNIHDWNTIYILPYAFFVK